MHTASKNVHKKGTNIYKYTKMPSVCVGGWGGGGVIC